MQGFSLIILSLLVTPQSGSDKKLEGVGLARFYKTRGASHAGRVVRWDVNGKVFNRRPLRRSRSYALYKSKGIGILVRLSDPGLSEVRRKGGRACLRGRVRRVHKGKRRKGDPAFYLDVREVTRRRK